MAEVSNDVLATKLTAVESQVNKLESKLDAYAAHFVTAEVYELKHRELDLKTESLSLKVDSMAKGNAVKLWISATLSAGGGIVLAFLIQFYLDHVGR